MIDAHTFGVHLAVVLLHPHVRAGENGSGESYKSRQGDQKYIQRINKKLLPPNKHRPVSNNLSRQDTGRNKSAQTENDIDIARHIAVAGKPQHHRTHQRNTQNEVEDVQGQSSLSDSRW